MRTDDPRAIALILISLVASLAGSAPGQVVLDGRRHHLGVAGQPEWDDFAGHEPEGRSLELKFDGKVTDREATLLIRQEDVKLDWPVRLNGRALGKLVTMEAALLHALAVPPGALRDGENTLALGPAPQADDIVITEVSLDRRPLREALGRCTLEVSVTDGDSGAGLPCRITIVDARHSLAALWTEPGAKLAARPGVVYTPDGRARIWLLPGDYRVHATRGFEYGLASSDVSLSEGQTRPISLSVRREVPTPGVVACDTHVHTLTHSGHGDATIDERAITLAGEGIELPIATDHDHLTTDLGAAAERMGVRRYFTPVVGDEVTTRAGHFNAFPFPNDATPPDPKLTSWADIVRAIRSAPGERAIILNHARDLHAGFRPFDLSHFNPVTGEHRRGPLGVDAMETINSGATQSDPMLLFRDWMALLNHGERLTAVGASDSHDVSRFIVGQGRTYIACPDSDPAHLDVDRACRSLRQSRATVSLGLLVRMKIDDRFAEGDLVTKLGDLVRVEVEVFGPSWTSADRVELYANGTKIRSESITPPASTLKVRLAWTLPRPPHDTYLIAIASGPGVKAPYWAIARPYQPTSRSWTPRVLGATNPVYLDGDADAEWTSPRAYAVQILGRAGTDPEKLVRALDTHDEAVASQAASLCHAAGLDLKDTAFTRQIAEAPKAVRRGFAAFVATLP